MTDLARALWTIQPGRVQWRATQVAPPAPGELQLRALMSGLSRGTERLIFQGQVPKSEWGRMRCPFQEGEFPFPVKYGYAMVGQVDAGPAHLIGQRMFSLYPHQSLFNIPAQAAIAVPDAIPTARAVLAPQMETALNATWDAEPRAGDSIAVVGAGVIGLLTAYLCAKGAGAATVIDINPDRAELARALGLDFAAPHQAPTDCDLVFHASATSAGLNLALSLAKFEATVIDLSWYGDKPVAVDLGGAFHSQRLMLKASQVGHVAPSHRADWDHRRRLAEALSLCADPRLDALVSRSTPFVDIPDRLGAILGDPDTLCHLIHYEEP
jgi:2-desacetyl-2-hydroxyethyl bacteriochlorophyllide A dehydrogenase